MDNQVIDKQMMTNIVMNAFSKSNALHWMKLTMNTLSYEVVSEVDKIFLKYSSKGLYLMSMTLDLSKKTTTWVVLETTQPRVLDIQNGERVKMSHLVWEEINNSSLANVLGLNTISRNMDISPVTRLYFGGVCEKPWAFEEIDKEYNLPREIRITYRERKEVVESFQYPLVIFLNATSQQNMEMSCKEEYVDISFYKKFKDYVTRIDPQFDLGSCVGISYALGASFVLKSELPTFKNDPCCIAFLTSFKAKNWNLKLPKFLIMKILRMSKFFLKPGLKL